jgi:hypothetical protein
VHNDVGVGLDEATYHQSLLDCFSDKGVPAISKPRKYLIHLDEKEKKIIEEYSEIKGKIGESMRQLLAKVRDAILFVYEAHGLGYGTAVCRDLLRAELDYQKIVGRFYPLIIKKFKISHLNNPFLCQFDEG